MLKEAVEYLDVRPGSFLIDGTFGEGGYTNAILEKLSGSGSVIALDWSREAIERGKTKFAKEIESGKLTLENENFANVKEVLEKLKLPKADGLVLDLGFSSTQIEEYGRGFSFMKDEPLLMTYSDDEEPLMNVLKDLDETDMAKIIKEYGGERFSGRIARSIVARMERKPIKTTFELVDAISSAVPRGYERGRIHPATRTFLAFRIFINKELQNLDSVLASPENFLKSGGRMVVISFQSLEDGIIKRGFRNLKDLNKAEMLTKKPLAVDYEESKINPRSRSAKLRAIKIL